MTLKAFESKIRAENLLQSEDFDKGLRGFFVDLALAEDRISKFGFSLDFLWVWNKPEKYSDPYQTFQIDVYFGAKTFKNRVGTCTSEYQIEVICNALSKVVR